MIGPALWPRVKHTVSAHRNGGPGGKGQPPQAPAGLARRGQQRGHSEAREGDAQTATTEVEREDERGTVGRARSQVCGQAGANDEGDRAGDAHGRAQDHQQREIGRQRAEQQPDGGRGQARGERPALAEAPCRRGRGEGAGQVAGPVCRVERPGLGEVPAKVRSHARQQQRVRKAGQAERHGWSERQPECHEQGAGAAVLCSGTTSEAWQAGLAPSLAGGGPTRHAAALYP